MASDAFKKALGAAVQEKVGATLPAFIEPLLLKYGITPDTIKEYAERIAGLIQSVDTRLNELQKKLDDVYAQIDFCQMSDVTTRGQIEEIARMIHQSQGDTIPAGEIPLEAFEQLSNQTGLPNGEMR